MTYYTFVVLAKCVIREDKRVRDIVLSTLANLLLNSFSDKIILYYYRVGNYIIKLSLSQQSLISQSALQYVSCLATSVPCREWVALATASKLSISSQNEVPFWFVD